MGSSAKSASFLYESRLRDAARGDHDASLDLGMIYSSGTDGAQMDLVEAHKWFNIAAVQGNAAAKGWRAELAHEMTAFQINEAQKAARAWLQGAQRHPA